MEVSNMLLDALSTNQNILHFRKDPGVPFGISLAFGTMLNKLRPYAEAVSEEKQKIFNKYCDKDENGENLIEEGRLHFSGGNAKKVTDELNQLFEAKTNLDGILTEKIRIDSNKIDEGLSSDDVMVLLEIVEFYDGNDDSGNKVKRNRNK